MNKIASKFRSTKGEALVEYGLLVGMIAAVAVVVVVLLGGTVQDTFHQVSHELENNASTVDSARTAAKFQNGASEICDGEESRWSTCR